MRSSDVEPRLDIGVRYFTSSPTVRGMLKKYGAESFKIKVVAVLPSRKRANELETRLLKKFRVRTNDRFLNRAVTAEEWNTLKRKPWNYGLRYDMTAEERREKFGRTGEDNGFFGRRHKPESLESARKKLSKRFCGSGNPFFGKNHSPSTVAKLRSDRLKPITVKFLDGRVVTLDDRKDLGTLLGMSASLGAKLVRLEHHSQSATHLWDKYGIERITHESSICEKTRGEEASLRR